MRWRFPEALLAVLLVIARPAAAARVVSLNLCTDQWLILLAPEQIAAITPLSRDPRLSPYADRAARLPVVRADAEAVLALKPDLVLAGPYGAQATLSVLQASGVPVAQIADGQTRDEIAAAIARVSRLLGVAARGDALIATLRATWPAHPPRGARAVLWQARGQTAGPGTLGDAILRSAGYVNIGTGGGMTLERLIAAAPDLVVSDTAPPYPSRAEEGEAILQRAGLATRRLPPAWLSCGGLMAARAAAELAR